MWVDTYDYAIRAEWLGVGIWGNRRAAPAWRGEEVSQAILEVTTHTSQYHQKARALATQQAGRVVAAREIVRMVREDERSDQLLRTYPGFDEL